MKSWRSILLWAAVSLAGAGSLAVVALHRGEHISALWLIAAALCVFAIAYRFHAAWLAAKVLTLDDHRATPACVHDDGKDFVKTNTWITFGHHFAAIAGPGPLVGPVLASQFGYLPGSLWILIGATFGGAVHDSIILFASLRRDGKSLGQMIKEEVNNFAGAIALVSILAILVILIAVLGLVVVKALAESPWGVFTIAMTIPIAMAMGGAIRFVCPGRIGWVTLFGVLGLAGSVWVGQFVAHQPGWGWLEMDGPRLAWAIILYGLAASILPVWLLLAPRDYLSTFMKIGTVAVLAVAVILVAPGLKMPAVTRFIDGTGLVFAGPLFPFCFITIACGAVSGFHALISSGTTPKLVLRESCVKTVGYTAMITEMLVGIMALIAACALEPGVYFAINMKGEPAAVVAAINAAGFPLEHAQMETLAADVGEKSMYGRTGGAVTFAVGMAHMFAKALGGGGLMALWYHFAIMFEALFILTTIDAGTRVGRFLLQDALGQIWKPLGNTRSWTANFLASVLFVGAWGWFLYQGVVDPRGGINSLWPIFGIANQLLAVVAFAFGTTLLLKMGRARFAWTTFVPLIWLFIVTMTAGWMKIFSPDPRLGFLAEGRAAAEKLATGAAGLDLAALQRQILNTQINTAVTAAFLGLVVLIVGACAREWFLLLAGRKQPVLREAPYVPAQA